MGWVAGWLGRQRLAVQALAQSLAGTGIGGLNVVRSLADWPVWGLFDGSGASTHTGAAPSAGAESTGANRGAGRGRQVRARGPVGPVQAGALAPSSPVPRTVRSPSPSAPQAPKVGAAIGRGAQIGIEDLVLKNLRWQEV